MQRNDVQNIQNDFLYFPANLMRKRFKQNWLYKHNCTSKL